MNSFMMKRKKVYIYLFLSLFAMTCEFLYIPLINQLLSSQPQRMGDSFRSYLLVSIVFCLIASMSNFFVAYFKDYSAADITRTTQKLLVSQYTKSVPAEMKRYPVGEFLQIHENTISYGQWMTSIIEMITVLVKIVLIIIYTILFISWKLLAVLLLMVGFTSMLRLISKPMVQRYNAAMKENTEGATFAKRIASSGVL